MVVISSYDLIHDAVILEQFNKIAKMKDSELKKSALAFMICEIAKGVYMIPTKQHKVRLAKELLKNGIEAKKIAKLLEISEKTIRNLQRKDS